MEKQDPRFSGGGTPISSLVEKPQQQAMPQQQTMPQQQAMMPQQQQAAMMQQQQQQQAAMMQQQQQRMQNIRSIPGGKVENFSEKFENFTNCSWQRFLALVILIVIFNNSFVYDFEKNLIPIGMRFGDPPLLAVFLNALFVGIIFLLISKFT